MHRFKETQKIIEGHTDYQWPSDQKPALLVNTLCATFPSGSFPQADEFTGSSKETTLMAAL